MNIFSQFIKSFYSPRDIASFRFQGIGKTILYIFVMMAIVNLPAAFNISIFINSGVQYIEQLTEEVPEFELRNGILHSELEAPYISEVEDGIIILDTTGTVSREDLEGIENGLALLPREAIVISDGMTEEVRYRDFGNLNLSKEDIDSVIHAISGLITIIIPLILLAGYLFITALKFIGVSFLAVIAILLKKQAQLPLRYRHLWILAAYVVTLPTALFAVLESFGIFISYSFFLYWAIAISLFYFVLQKIPKPKKKVETELSPENTQ